MSSENTIKKYIVVNIKPETADIFEYKMYHAFLSNGQGIARIIISVLFLFFGFFGLGRYEWYLTLALFLIGILNPVVTPLMYYSQAKNTAKTRITTTFSFYEKKITADDGKKKLDLPWEDIFYIVWTKKQMLLYTAPSQALLLPKRQMNGQEDDILAMIKAYAKPNRFRILKSAEK